MKIIYIKHPKGQRAQITDESAKMVWQGNICKTKKAAKTEALEGFIDDKKQGLAKLKSHYRGKELNEGQAERFKAAKAAINSSIRKLRKML